MAFLALIIRIESRLTVNDTTNKRWGAECPTMTSRSSAAERSGSSKILASGSAKTVAASTKATPCFLRLEASLAGCHSKMMLNKEARYHAQSADLRWRNGGAALLLAKTLGTLSEKYLA